MKNKKIKNQKLKTNLKRNKLKYTIATVLIMIIFVSNYKSIPIPDAPFYIKNFEVSGEEEEFRTGEELTFHYSILGTPEKVLLILGDGNILDITH